MKKLRPYFVPVVTLATDLLTLGWRVIRQVILPTLTRKGNLLSSLFVLFTGLIEQVIGFAETIARIPTTFQLPARFEHAWAFSRKYLRQGMLIAAWALFILSSLEWSSTQPAAAGHATDGQTAAEQTAGRPTAPEQTTIEQTASLTTDVGQSQQVGSNKDNDLAIALPPAVHVPIYPPPSPTPRWLLLCTLLI